MTDDIGSASVRIDPDLSFFKDKLAAGLSAATAGQDRSVEVTVGVNADTAAADSKMAVTKGTADTLGKTQETIKVDADTSRANTEMGATKLAADALGRTSETIKVNVDGAGAKTALDDIGKAAGDAGGASGGGMGLLLKTGLILGPALEPLVSTATGLAAGLGGIGVAAVAGMEAVKLAIGPAITQVNSIASAQEKYNQAVAAYGPFSQQAVSASQALTTAAQGASPAALAAAQGMTTFKEALAGWQNTFQPQAFALLSQGLSTATSGLGLLTPVVQGALGGLQNLLGSFQQLAANAHVMDLFTSLGMEVNEVFSALGPVLTNVLTGILQFMQAANPLINIVLGLLVQVSEAFVNLPIGQILDDLTSKFEQLAPIVGQFLQSLVEVVGGILTAIAPIGTAMFQVISATITALLPVIKVLGDAIGAVAPIVGALAEALAGALGGAIEALAPVLQSVIPIIAQIAEAMGTTLADSIKALSPLLDAAIKVFVPFFQGILAGLGPVTGAFSDLMKAITPLTFVFQAVAQSIAGLGPTFGEIGKAIGQLIGPAAEVLAQFAQFAGTLAANVTPAIVILVGNVLTALIPAINSLVPFLTSMASLIGTSLTAAVQTLSPFLSVFATILGVTLKGAIEAVATILVAITPLLTGIAGVIKDLPTPVLGLAAAFLIWKTNLFGIAGSITGIVGAVRGFAGAVVSLASGALNLVSSALDKLGLDSASAAFGRAGTAAEGFATTVSGAMGEAATATTVATGEMDTSLTGLDAKMAATGDEAVAAGGEEGIGALSGGMEGLVALAGGPVVVALGVAAAAFVGLTAVGRAASDQQDIWIQNQDKSAISTSNNATNIAQLTAAGAGLRDRMSDVNDAMQGATSTGTGFDSVLLHIDSAVGDSQVSMAQMRGELDNLNSAYQKNQAATATFQTNVAGLSNTLGISKQQVEILAQSMGIDLTKSLDPTSFNNFKNQIDTDMVTAGGVAGATQQVISTQMGTMAINATNSASNMHQGMKSALEPLVSDLGSIGQDSTAAILQKYINTETAMGNSGKNIHDKTLSPILALVPDLLQVGDTSTAGLVAKYIDAYGPAANSGKGLHDSLFDQVKGLVPELEQTGDQSTVNLINKFIVKQADALIAGKGMHDAIYNNLFPLEADLNSVGDTAGANLINQIIIKKAAATAAGQDTHDALFGTLYPLEQHYLDIGDTASANAVQGIINNVPEATTAAQELHDAAAGSGSPMAALSNDLFLLGQSAAVQLAAGLHSQLPIVSAAAAALEGAANPALSPYQGGVPGATFTGGTVIGGVARTVGERGKELFVPGSLSGLPHFAAGGAIDGAAIVGENGPEVFVPPSAGTIVPNDQVNTGGTPAPGASVAAWQQAPAQLKPIWDQIQSLYTTFNTTQLNSTKDSGDKTQADIQSTWQQVAALSQTAWTQIAAQYTSYNTQQYATTDDNGNQVQSNIQQTWTQIKAATQQTWTEQLANYTQVNATSLAGTTTYGQNTTTALDTAWNQVKTNSNATWSQMLSDYDTSNQTTLANTNTYGQNTINALNTAWTTAHTNTNATVQQMASDLSFANSAMQNDTETKVTAATGAVTSAYAGLQQTLPGVVSNIWTDVDFDYIGGINHTIDSLDTFLTGVDAVGAQVGWNANLNVPHLAAGDQIGRFDKTTAIVAEAGYPEYVIPTDPKYRDRAMSLVGDFYSEIGPTKMATGGVLNPAVVDASQFLGTPYVFGGTSSAGVDCSGLIYLIGQELGIPMARTSEDQFAQGPPAAGDAAGQPIFFNTGATDQGPPQHVGLSLGGGQMIDAPHTGAVVRQEGTAGFGSVMGETNPFGAAAANLPVWTPLDAPDTLSGEAPAVANALAAQVSAYLAAQQQAYVARMALQAQALGAADTQISGPLAGQLTQFFSDVLAGIGAPNNATTMGDLAAWQHVEGGWTDNPDTFNPWGTTLPMGGSHATNSAGVQAYPTYAAGVAASISMLNQGNMAAIKAALDSSAPLGAFESAVSGTQWGTQFEAGGRIPVKSYDSGGILSPGVTLAMNGTGRDEVVGGNSAHDGPIFGDINLNFYGNPDQATIDAARKMVRSELTDAFVKFKNSYTPRGMNAR